MIAGILQTNYLPWSGVIEMMDRCDVFVYHNDIQYNLSWRNRNRIRVPSSTGWIWLSVPVKLADGSRTLINQAKISYDHPWNRKHWNLIYEHYHNAPYFDEYAEPYREIFLEKEWKLLVDLNNALMDVIQEQIGLECDIIFTEDLNLGDTVKNDRVIRICKEVGADTWLANSAGRDYVDPESYDEVGIKLVFQDYDPPVYKQQYEPFVSHLSIIDMIFNCGRSTLELIRKAREGSPHYE